LAVIILLFSVLLFYLYKRRLEIMDSMSEGFVSPNNILALNSNVNSLPLCQYCIKASHNSALVGNDPGNLSVSLDMLDTVLRRGCRFIDFEVYFVNRLPVVAYTTDLSYSSITTSNYIPLQTILDRAVVTGFTSAPNNNDPLFIQLRIKAVDDSVYIILYREVAKVLDALFPSNSQLSRFYTNPTTGNAAEITSRTRLSDIMGKVIIVTDITTNENYVGNTNCISKSAPVVNKSGSSASPSQAIKEAMTTTPDPTTKSLPTYSGATTGAPTPTGTTKSAPTYSGATTGAPTRTGTTKSAPTYSVATTGSPTTTSPTTGPCYDLKKYVNLNNGNELLRTNDYATVLGESNNPPYIMNDTMNTSVTAMRYVYPGISIPIQNPSNISSFIMNHGCQIIAYQYNQDDDGLADCEQFFSDNKFAFVPISKAIRYYNKKLQQQG
jgi:hypothetical protein